MKVIDSKEFDSIWNNRRVPENNDETEKIVKEIIGEVRAQGDAAVRRYTLRFDKGCPRKFEVPLTEVKESLDNLRMNNPELASAMEYAANNIAAFSLRQKEQFMNFEYDIGDGLAAGQRVIPIQRAAVYIPAGRFPLFSTVLMTLIPAFYAGVEEIILASPPMEDGFPDRRILAAAGIALNVNNGVSRKNEKKLKVFAIGGAQAITALALGTESIPKTDFIAGPGNKYVAAAKRALFGEVGIDFIAGPTDVLIITDGTGYIGHGRQAADLVAADMIAQSEHDPDACARALVANRELAEQICDSIEQQLSALPYSAVVRASLESNGLIIAYNNKEEAVSIANTIAPEHLELQTSDTDWWIPMLKNFGSLFIGSFSAEVLGDYSAGINHTLPTAGSARFTGGLSVRNFLKTVTTLRCAPGSDYKKACNAAEVLAKAEGLLGHAGSATLRMNSE